MKPSYIVAVLIAVALMASYAVPPPVEQPPELVGGATKIQLNELRSVIKAINCEVTRNRDGTLTLEMVDRASFQFRREKSKWEIISQSIIQY